MCVKLSRNKHQAHPKSTRGGHLLCVVLSGSDREKQNSSQEGSREGEVVPWLVRDLRQDSISLAALLSILQNGGRNNLILQYSGDHVE